MADDGPVDIEELLEKLRGTTRSGSGGNGNSNGGRKSNLTVQQQADALRVALGAYINPPPLKIGDFVRYREECAPYIKQHDRLAIIIGTIDPPMKIEATEDNVGSCIAHRQYDTVLATTDHTRDAGILKYLCDKRDLELWPEGEKLNTQHS